MMKLKRSMTMIIAFLLMMLLIGGCTQGVEEKTDTVTVTDLMGREVEVKAPAERIVLVSARQIHEMAALLGSDFSKKIVGWGSDLKAYDKDTYEVFAKAFPEIEEIPDVGYHYQGTFSVEMVISLNPDVVVFPLWLEEDETALQDIDKLEQAGIPSVFVDFYKDPFDHPVKSMTLFGKITGQEERAAEISAFYQAQVDLVEERLGQVEQPKPTVYVECGNKGPSEYGNTYSDKGWGAVVQKSGGKNIAEGVIEGSGPMNPEYLLKANPDVIILSGSNWEGTEDSVKLGYYAELNDSLERLNKFTERAGWDTLSAVQNQRVYSIYHGLSFRIYNFAGIQAFAKWNYPDTFADLNPSENLQAFHEQFMPVELSGVWMTGLDE